MRRLRSLEPGVLDVGLAVALSVWVLAAEVPGDPLRIAVLLAMTAAIAWRRRAPTLVLAVEVAGVVVLPDRLDYPAGIALLFAAYSAVLLSSRRWLVAALLVVAAAWQLAFGGEVDISKNLVPLFLLLPVWLAGMATRSRELRAEASAERAERIEREREASLRAERARIARELHDIVTHSVSLMVLQTGAAREIMSQDEERARSLLASVEASGRAAIEELHRLLGLLSDHDGDAPLSPQPGVSEIPTLVEQVRSAGINVELSVEGQPRALSGGATVAAYRVVQEALTNVVKHAEGAPVRVVVRWADDELELEILDEGPATEEAPPVASGLGITGMRERAATYGGTLEAGPRPDRGYAVRARLPLESR
jgi:signal transduction histidine kinase